MRYYVVFEPTETGWAAYPPELPGVGVAGSSRGEARDLIRGAIELHLDGLREDGLPIPVPTGEFIEVA